MLIDPIRDHAEQAATYYGDADNVKADPDVVMDIVNRWWESDKDGTYIVLGDSNHIRTVLRLCPAVLDAEVNAAHDTLSAFTHMATVVVSGCSLPEALDVVDEVVGADPRVQWFY